MFTFLPYWQAGIHSGISIFFVCLVDVRCCRRPLPNADSRYTQRQRTDCRQYTHSLNFGATPTVRQWCDTCELRASDLSVILSESEECRLSSGWRNQEEHSKLLFRCHFMSHCSLRCNSTTLLRPPSTNVYHHLKYLCTCRRVSSIFQFICDRANNLDYVLYRNV